MQSDYVLRKYDVLVFPDRHQSTEVLAAFARIVKSHLSTVDAQTIFFVASIDVEVAVDRV